MYDAVYRLHPAVSEFNELRYSLRTLQANTPIQRVHFFGGKPRWLKTDLHTTTRQRGDKWANSRVNLLASLDSDEVSDPFILMDDDFYILKPVDPLPVWHGGPVRQWLADLGARYANHKYVRWGYRTDAVLKKLGYDSPLWFDLHTPLLVHKDAMREALRIDEKHSGTLHPRTLYGNIAGLKAVRAPVHDVKVRAVPGTIYASSANATWERSPLGQHIRAKFTKPSRWE